MIISWRIPSDINKKNKKKQMKKTIAAIMLLTFTIAFMDVNAQLFNNAKKLIKQNSSKGLTEKDAAEGIKEALIKGTEQGVKTVSNVDGYFGNPEIKIPFPPDAKEIETKLRAVGLGKKVDEVVLSINRAAEDAAKEAKPIFIAAIKNMTITDAVNIVKGENNAATKYLQRTTSPELNKKFQPPIKASLDKVEATKHWAEVIELYNKIPFVKKMNPNLTEYVTGKAIEGLFVMVAKEELKIRKDPVARTSEILKKVFGQ
jgi:hypothetical protein